jgi:phosphatidylinositol alpha-1,6-mannosyltransferase
VSGGADDPARAPRVLALTHSLSDVDGVGRYAVGTLQELAPRCGGIEVYIGRRHRGLSPDLPTAGVTVHETLAADAFPFLSLPKLAWLLLTDLPTLVRAAGRADVVHSLSDYPLGFVAVLVARMARRPVVVSGLGTYAVTPTTMPGHRGLIGWMFRRADRFLAGSRYALARVREVAEPTGAEVVPYGVRPDAYSEAAALGVGPGVPGPYVLTVGEVKQRKGHTTSLPAFLEAWKRRPDLHYAIVGRHVADDPYFEALRALVAEAGAEQHVHFLGNVDEPRKVALMRGCLLFLLTPMVSDEGGFEAFGLVYLEAGAAGRPVIGTDGSGAEDAITDGENGRLCRHGDVDGIADAIVSLVEEPGRADAMGAAGLVRARGQTWEAAARRVADIYAELLDGRGASS